MSNNKDNIVRAAEAIAIADGILIGAGAGMGVDSGLPDFRGNEGFWRAYPGFQDRGLGFQDLANPRWFIDDPGQAWGFYGHRYLLYKTTEPHRGFAHLKRWSDEAANGGFVFTSNVDGHFQRSGFSQEQVMECHGSIMHLQCVSRCCDAIWPAGPFTADIDHENLRAEGDLPSCPHCGGLARPNILMFGDGGWLFERTEHQALRYREWLGRLANQSLVIIELGAGEAVPTVRHECERARGQLIRINPRDTDAPGDAIVVEMGALEALNQIADIIG